MPNPATLDALRRRIRLLERPAARDGSMLPFGVADIDDHLPERGLAQAALHEIAGGGADETHAACAALFAAGILARMERPVLWCTMRGCAARSDLRAPHLFAPGLARAGLHPDRVIHAEAGDERTVLLVMEEGLRHPGLSAVVGEVTALPMTASRRLVLAAEKSGVMALALRRRPEGRPEDTGLSAAATRWRIAPLPSGSPSLSPPSLSPRSLSSPSLSSPSLSSPSLSSGPVPGLGRARWQIDLSRCRGGPPRTWMMEACDAQGRLAVPAELAYGQAASRPLRQYG